MTNAPKTLKETMRYRYGIYPGDTKGHKYKNDFCAYAIWRSSGWPPALYQCSRKNGHGPDGLYCKQHSKKVKGEKDE